MTETINIDRSAIEDLQRIKEEFDSIMESIELMNDKEFMESLKRSDEQVKKREFADWNAL
ncbi:MAG: hypothetical protein AABX54_01075 [Nanoarchaeota archaeon]